MIITPISPADEPAVLTLNNLHARELSWLEADRLHHLIDQAFYARRVGALDAFILAFDQLADYDSPNFLWFRNRYARFVYVDRIAVAAHARGRGIARAIYHDLFTQASAHGHNVVTCEVNADPPNPESDAFHARLGFAAVGTAVIQGADKSVTYFARPLP